MNGRLFIDGHDAYTDYGVYVVQGGWDELIAMPPLKAVEYNDWHEDNGIEVDLSEPVLDTREVTIKFAVRGVNYQAFIDMLSDYSYHTFYCVYISRVYRLRMVSMAERTTEGDLGIISIRFADDFPLYNYTYKMPVRTILQEVTYLIDDKSLSNYNVRVLRGTLASLTRMPDVKPNLLINSLTQSGASYDNSGVTFKGKDVVLSCLMTADDLTTLWRNYDALLYDLTRPNTRTFNALIFEDTYPCYYKSCQVVEFYPDDSPWVKFNLTLSFFEGSMPVLLPDGVRRVEYLESTGIPYIDTGILSDWSGLVVSMEVEVFDTFTGASQYRYFFGSTYSPATRRSVISLERSAADNIRFYFKIGSGYNISPNNLTTHQTLTIDRPNELISGEYQEGSWSRNTSTFDWDVMNGNFNLFRVQGLSNTSPALAHSRFYMCRFIRSGVMIRDFIPVRVGNVGYMYDTVTKQLFGNASNSDAFILGSDMNNEEAYISRVEYIEGTGTQYIDTGISLYGCTDIDISMEVSPTDIYNYVALFGACPSAHKATECWIPSTGKTSMRIAAANTSSKVVSDVTAVIGERYKICASLHDRINTLTVNDNVVQSSIGSDTVTDDFNLTFLHRDGNTTAGKVRLYAASVKIGNEVRFDFVPARVGNTGYLYDKMSGLLFGSASEDAFVAGRDI